MAHPLAADVVRLRDEEKLSWQKIAERLGLTNRDQATRLYTAGRAAQLEPEPDTELPEPVVKPRRKLRLSEVVDLDPASFAVPVPFAPAPVPGKPTVGVIFGDSQVPFHDDRCLAVIEGVIRDVKPDILVHNGDLIDCWEISDYDRDPTRKESLQDDIDLSRTKLAQWAQLAPQARRYFLEGNHEDRLRRAIWKLPDTARQLAKLRAFQEAMTWPNLLKMDEIGWEWVATEAQSKADILPCLVTVHGHQVGNGGGVAGAMARKLMAKYGRSGIAGHCHRAGILMDRDHNGQQFGIETGCTCLLDGQPYGHGADPNWQQAVTVIEWSGDRKVMNVQQVIIREGRALWRGLDYAA